MLLGIGCAANPWGIMIAVLLLDARRGHGIVWVYVVAWIGAITVVLTAVLAGLGAIFESGSHSATTATAVVELALGLSLLAWGLQRLLAARRATTATLPARPSAPPQLPAWLRAIESISYLAAFLLGIYSATYPLVIAAAGEILRAGGSTAETVALAVLFILLGSSSVVAVAALGTFASPFGPAPRAHALLVGRAQPRRDHRHPARPRSLDHCPRPHRVGLIFEGAPRCVIGEGCSHRRTPVWPSENRPGWGQTQRPCGPAPTATRANSRPVRVEIA